MKPVITAQDIARARKAGQTRLEIAPGSIITPQARDDAKEYGITLTGRHGEAGSATGKQRQAECARAVAPNLESPQTPRQSLNEAAKPGRLPAPFPAEDIVRRVCSSLGGSVSPAVVRAVVSQVLAESMGEDTAALTGATAPAPAGVTFVAAATGGKPAPNAIQVEESLPPGPDGPGIGFLRFADTSFQWTFETDEVLLVQEGLLVLAADGEGNAGASVSLAEGDAARIKAGTALTLTAKGNVRCLASSWPR